ncbi:carbohydrate ABC transporter permease [Nonomuraea thailandensis]
MSHKKPLKRRRNTLPLHVIAIIVGVFMVIPVFYALLGGFKDNSELSGNPFGLPSEWITANYTDVLASGSFWRQVWNSTFIAVVTTVVTVALSALAAFVFARFAFRGRELYFTLFTAGLMFPFAVAILPIFVLLRTFGLLDNPLGVILTQAAFGLPLTIIILRGFFRSIPGEIEEAATIDGCSPFGFFWRILLPMARPAIATVSVLAIVGAGTTSCSRWWCSARRRAGRCRWASSSSRASTPPTPPASWPISSWPWCPRSGSTP